MTLTIEESVAAFKRASQDAIRTYREDPQKAKDFLMRAGIARVNPDTGELELVPQLQPTRP